MKKTSKTRCNDWRMEKQPRLTEQFVELQKKQNKNWISPGKFIQRQISKINAKRYVALVDHEIYSLDEHPWFD